MGRTAGRSPEQTRRLILDAAVAVIRVKSLTATLDDIAAEAGISKGGLIYHFASKDDLFLALGAELVDAFGLTVERQLEEADTAPGRLTRAYLRACFAPEEDDHTLRESIALTAQLMTLPSVAEYASAADRAWVERLFDDGLPPSVTSIVVAAADGVSLAPLWGGRYPDAQSHELFELLTRMTLAPAAAEDALTTLPLA